MDNEVIKWKAQSERLKELMSIYEITSGRQLAISIGMDSSQMNKVLRGELGLPYKQAVKLKEKYNADIDWLLEGNGNPPIRLNYPNLDNDPSPTFIEQRRGKKLKSDPYMVPFVPVKAQAGYIKAIGDDIYIDSLDKYSLPPGVNPFGAVWRYWEIEGDSMEPKFHTGDVILTSQVHHLDWQNLQDYYVYVIVTEERVMIKRIFCKNDLEWVLISENEENYPQQLLPIEYVKEVWVYRKTWKTDAAPTKRFVIKV